MARRFEGGVPYLDQEHPKPTPSNPKPYLKPPRNPQVDQNWAQKPFGFPYKEGREVNNYPEAKP